MVSFFNPLPAHAHTQTSRAHIPAVAISLNETSSLSECSFDVLNNSLSESVILPNKVSPSTCKKLLAAAAFGNQKLWNYAWNLVSINPYLKVGLKLGRWAFWYWVQKQCK